MKAYFIFFTILLSSTIYTQNESKLVLDASNIQTNNNPIIRMRNSNGIDLMWLHSDSPFNTFAGYNSGYSNNGSGVANTFIGSESGYSNSSGAYNTSIGYAALYKNVGNSSNTAVGALALQNTTASSFNTALGANAGDTYNNGYNNVFIGANTDVDQNGLFNVIAVGQGTIVSANSTARFGNSATVSYGGFAGWTNISDGRFKKNVKANVAGLEFIMLLEPVTYNLDVSGISSALQENHATHCSREMKTAITEKEKTIQTGFIAQDVEAAARSIGYDFSGVDAPKSETDLYGLRYSEFVVPLVKAVQELNSRLISENEYLDHELYDLQVKFAALQSENETLACRLSKIEEAMAIAEIP